MDYRSLVEGARHAFAERRWSAAVQGLQAADGERPLSADDLVLLATAAILVGEDQLGVDTWARAHRAHLEAGNVGAAVRCAFSVGMHLVTAGDEAQGGGWLARGHRLLDDLPADAPERTLMRFPEALQQMFDGSPEPSIEAFVEVADVGSRIGDATMAALGCLGHGQALIMLGSIPEGLRRFDEAMVGVTAGEVGPIESGIIYCAVIDACHEMYDLDRAREWTAALARWCEAQPDLVPFRGQCLVHRSQVLQHGGDWPAASKEAALAAERLSQPTPRPALGAARYQQGEMHRLAGETTMAEAAFRDAVAFGHSAHPGLALLRLQQGRTDDAHGAIQRELDERTDAQSRCAILPAYVTIAVRLGDLDRAGTAAHELTAIATDSGSAMLRATALQASGHVALARGAAKEALPMLRGALTLWQSLDVPYELARTRVVIGHACLALDDADTAVIEWDAARRTFEDLGAVPDLEAVNALLPAADTAASDGLTGREVEVLALLATGMTNRKIAERLVISEKTVARHLSNIYTKLGVSSRAAATAYAFRHGMT